MSCEWGCFEFDASDADCARYGLGAMALRYAWMGYAVLPLQAGGKRPHRMLGSSGGVHHATTDSDQIRAWWAQSPGANIGVSCGADTEWPGPAGRGGARRGGASRGMAVLDLDTKHGQDGPGVFAAFLRDSRLPFPAAAPWVRTPSGGVHIWLRAEGRVPHRPGILSGVDVIGSGGLAVCPPSMLAAVPLDRSGGGTAEVGVPYTWAAGCPHALPDAPPWLLPWLERAGSTGAGRTDDRMTGTDRQDGPPAVGQRNRGMYVLACSLYRKLGTGPAGAWQVREKLKDTWNKTDHADFSWQEVLVCAESARRFIERSTAAEDARNARFLAWLYQR